MRGHGPWKDDNSAEQHRRAEMTALNDMQTLSVIVLLLPKNRQLSLPVASTANKD